MPLNSFDTPHLVLRMPRLKTIKMENHGLLERAGSLLYTRLYDWK